MSTVVKHDSEVVLNSVLLPQGRFSVRISAGPPTILAEVLRDLTQPTKENAGDNKLN
jgi:hypothetical protein